MYTVSLDVPNVIWLEKSTIALYPIAVEYEILFPIISVFDPKNVLYEPPVIPNAEYDPTAVL